MSSQVVWMSRGKLLVWTGIFTSMHVFFGIHVGNYTMGPTGCSKKLCRKKTATKIRCHLDLFVWGLLGGHFVLQDTWEHKGINTP